MDIKEALQTSLNFEEKGHHIYEEVSKKTKNPIVARTFRYLAGEELNHIKGIKRYMEKEKIELKGDKPEDTKRFFTMTVNESKEKTELSDDDLKAHETALELEQKSYDFYKKQKDEAEDAESKKFFGFLMKQENTHYILIEKAYDFIKNPAGFYSIEERWVVEGG